jgi:beta-lactamase superfamily II metal-dependent hydrolase
VLDVGQGDGVLVSFPNGKHLLVDGGVAGYGEDAGARVILPVLRRLGIRRLDAVIASHPHADHVGGLVSVLQQVDVGHYVDSGQYYSSSTARRIRNLIREKGIAHHVVAAGDSIVGFGPVGLSVLHPRSEFVNKSGEAPDGLNNGSVVVRMDYEGQSVLFTGDIEHETDLALLAWGTRLRATILKAAHHGSRTSSTRAFLDAVSPEWVAVSCGVDNKFRHPAPEVMERYESIGAISDRTDLSGCLTYRIRDSGVEVQRYLGR